MSATGCFLGGLSPWLSGDFAVLIARLIADPQDLETRLDAATAALEGEGMRVAAAVMLDFCGDVLQIMLPDGDPATKPEANVEGATPQF